ncbi:MAG: 4'-phosphopantetheinyl transferase superfamily protein [Elusimicrobia bacterium]|nr:4'-phosphopantetheinyl transferase superfamily protein [Elusimicrobiota bacterium]
MKFTNPEPAGLFLTCVCLPEEARELELSADKRGTLLGPEERACYGRLRSQKRRWDWLSGRAAAKRVLRRYFQEIENRAVGLADIEIAPDAQGAPVCVLPGAPSFSITHCAEGGLCAVGLDRRRVGADWEIIAPRARALARLFARPGELPEDADDRATTALWAVKEALLKLLGLGLACPPTDVEVRAEPVLHGRARERWAGLGAPRLAFSVTDRGGSLTAVAYEANPQGGS